MYLPGFMKFAQTLPDPDNEPPTDFYSAVSDYDRWRRHLAKEQQRNVPIVLSKSRLSDDVWNICLRIIQAARPLSTLPEMWNRMSHALCPSLSESFRTQTASGSKGLTWNQHEGRS